MPPTHTADLNAVTLDISPDLALAGLSQRQIDELGGLYADR
jgi:hypothetical protein